MLSNNKLKRLILKCARQPPAYVASNYFGNPIDWHKETLRQILLLKYQRYKYHGNNKTRQWSNTAEYGLAWNGFNFCLFSIFETTVAMISTLNHNLVAVSPKVFIFSELSVNIHKRSKQLTYVTVHWSWRNEPVHYFRVPSMAAAILSKRYCLYSFVGFTWRTNKATNLKIDFRRNFAVIWKFLTTP